VSGQLEAEIMAMAFTDVYTFGPTFRAENSNTSRHLAEFWMVEPEMAFCDLIGNMDLAEAFLKHIFRTVLEQCPEDMEFFNKRIDDSVLATADNIISNTFERITYTDAVKLLEKPTAPLSFRSSGALTCNRNMSATWRKNCSKSRSSSPTTPPASKPSTCGSTTVVKPWRPWMCWPLRWAKLSAAPSGKNG
jgi:aspartyl/asparaginyl-tRNA synthetase